MWRSTLEIGAALLNKSGWRLFTDTGHGRLVNKKKLIEWKTLVHFVRIESVDFLWTTAIEISRYGDALSCKKEAHLLLSKKRWKYGERGGVAVCYAAGVQAKKILDQKAWQMLC